MTPNKLRATSLDAPPPPALLKKRPKKPEDKDDDDDEDSSGGITIKIELLLPDSLMKR